MRKAKVTETFPDSVFRADTLAVPAMDYGRRNEVKAKSKYLETSHDRHLHERGLVVTNEFPFLGASPDGKVCDAGQCGILEIKCPYETVPSVKHVIYGISAWKKISRLYG